MTWNGSQLPEWLAFLLAIPAIGAIYTLLFRDWPKYRRGWLLHAALIVYAGCYYNFFLR